MMEKVMVSITKEMKDALETERKKRLLDSIPETIRTIISEYLSNRGKTPDINEILRAAVKEYQERKK
jgi:metal-responsive CopG/Arc/MetJ family transcriptional regulator